MDGSVIGMDRLENFWRTLKHFALVPFVYLPILSIFLICSMKYHKNPIVLVNLNPSFKSGGLTCKKDEINSKFKKASKYFLKTILIKPSQDTKRQIALIEKNFKYPIILKPNCGFAGKGVYFVLDRSHLLKLMEKISVDYLVQEYESSPGEFGVLFIRDKKEIQIKIIQREFPKIFGDGKRTIGEIISTLPLDREVTKNNLKKINKKPTDILPKGQFLNLPNITTIYNKVYYKTRDDLLTPPVLNKFRSISDVQGFNYGRYDIKIENEEKFKKLAQSFRIMEVNVGCDAIDLRIFDHKNTFSKDIKIIYKDISKAYKISIANDKKNKRSLFFKEYREYKELLKGYEKNLLELSKVKD